MLVLTPAALAVGAVAWPANNSDLADACLITGTIAGLIPAIGWVVGALAHKRVGGRPHRPSSPWPGPWSWPSTLLAR